MLKILEFLSVLGFFIAYKQVDIIFATKILVASTLLIALIHWVVERKLPYSNIATAAIVTIFGSITIYTDNPVFIKMKPTVIYVLFAAVILGMLHLGKKNIVRMVLCKTLDLSNKTWNKLAHQWAVFFIILAISNEFVWRNYSENTWVNFKVFGISIVLFVFLMLQLYLLRHSIIKR